MITREVLATELQHHHEALETAKELDGAELLASIEQASESQGLNLGAPPFFIKLDQYLVGLLDEHGRMAPLPYGFPVEDADINRDCDSVCGIPTAGGAYVHMIPANRGIETECWSDGETFAEIADELPEELWAHLEHEVNEMGEALKGMARRALVPVIAVAYHGAYPGLCKFRREISRDGQQVEIMLADLFTMTLLRRNSLMPLLWQAFRDSTDTMMEQIQAKIAAEQESGDAAAGTRGH